VQGMISSTLGILTYWWMVDFPENAGKSFRFLSDEEVELATRRIENDRHDVLPEQISWSKIAVHFLDIKLYGFCSLFFLLNLVSTSLSYFLPIILQSGMGFDTGRSILLSAPVRPQVPTSQTGLPVSKLTTQPFPAILLRHHSCPHHLIPRRQVPPPWALDSFQRTQPHRRFSHARSSSLH
jgi:hypothetical protein